MNLEDSKFQKGDEVVYLGYKGDYDGKVFGVAEKENPAGQRYAITIKEENRIGHLIVAEDRIIKKKEADELEEDDRFIGVDGVEYIVCGREYSENDKAMCYLAKAVPSGNIYLIDEFGIEEVKY
ncbi:MAG: hypothetical protein AWU54_419 [Candidatus Frackibacter sp. T328-2]|jgi:hypothetical protein|nr:MAG: hypothetical protein AWU54_419 [Candidatus Frackibacter sp. T328-2]